MSGTLLVKDVFLISDKNMNLWDAIENIECRSEFHPFYPCRSPFCKQIKVIQIQIQTNFVEKTVEHWNRTQVPSTVQLCISSLIVVRPEGVIPAMETQWHILVVVFILVSLPANNSSSSINTSRPQDEVRILRFFTRKFDSFGPRMMIREGKLDC